MTAPECLRHLFTSVFMDNTEDEALQLWEYMCDAGGPYPEEALACLDAALEDPPDDLVDIMRESGWISLVHQQPDGRGTPYTSHEHLQWLRETTDRLREIFARSRAQESPQ